MSPEDDKRIEHIDEIVRGLKQSLVKLEGKLDNISYSLYESPTSMQARLVTVEERVANIDRQNEQISRDLLYVERAYDSHRKNLLRGILASTGTVVVVILTAIVSGSLRLTIVGY